MRCRTAIAYGLGLTLGLTGCFAKPKPDTDYGPQPVNYEQAVKDYFYYLLKDPESARYDFDYGYYLATKGYCNTGLAYGGDVVWYGWAIPVRINAKNSFGGYTGWSTHWVLFSPSGKPVDDVERPTFDDILCTSVR